MSKTKIRTTVFEKGDIRTYIALIGFLIWGIIGAVWIVTAVGSLESQGMLQTLYTLRIHLVIFMSSWIAFLLVLLGYLTSPIEIGDDYIAFPPKYKLSLKCLQFDEIKEIKYEVTKHGRGVRGVWIIDKEDRKYPMRTLSDWKKIVETLREKMPMEEWKKKSNITVLDKEAPTRGG